MEEINIDEFSKIDLRVAKIIEVFEVEDADKLIQLKLDLGDSGIKTVFAGIKAAYKLEELYFNEFNRGEPLNCPYSVDNH